MSTSKLAVHAKFLIFKCDRMFKQLGAIYIKKPIKVKTTFTVPMSCFCGFSASPTVVIPSCKRSKIISFTLNNITDCFFMRNNVSLRDAEINRQSLSCQPLRS